MKLNVYIDRGVRLFTPLIWQEFFTNYMPNAKVHYVSGPDILKDNPDAIVFPGGSGSVFSKCIDKKGIQDWVNDGGKYIGVCAGVYLASNSYEWSLGLSSIEIDKKWRRGNHYVKLEIGNDVKDVEFFNGPLLKNYTDITVLAKYHKGIPNGNIYEYNDSPAIYTNDYGKGKVLLISPHLERTDLLKEDLYNILTEFIIYK